MFNKGEEETALETGISPLMRYFSRPAGSVFDALKYNEYFEQFMVSVTCPVALRDRVTLGTSDGARAAPTDLAPRLCLDTAPPPRQRYVYSRCRGQAPLCRLEIKFPNQKEVFYLRNILLHYPKRSFDDCMRYSGRRYKSFETAARATGLFTKHDESFSVLQEMVDLRYTGAQLRFAFVVLLDQDASPNALYAKFETQLVKDHLDRGVSLSSARALLRKQLQDAWVSAGHSLEHWPLRVTRAPGVAPNAAIARRVPAAESAFAALQTLVRADSAQQAVADRVHTGIQANHEGFIFVEGRSGTGKSTLASYLTHSLNNDGVAVLNVATTGLAALQLPMGATAHSTFGISLDDTCDIVCNVSFNSARARSIASTKLIQWDEWPAAKRTAWDAVFAFLQELQVHLPEIYVPKIIVCYGDFRQIPPVVPRGTRQDIVAMSVRTSPSWFRFKVFSLKFRHRQASDRAFGTWLGSIGDGTAPTRNNRDGAPGFVQMSMCRTVDSEDAALSFCFPSLNDPPACSKSRILCTTNVLGLAILNTPLSISQHVLRHHVSFCLHRWRRPSWTCSIRVRWTS